MDTPFDRQTGTWRIAWPGRVARHDLVYLTPPQDPMEGMPLGNGEVGVLAWCEGPRLVLAVNRSDLWDDGAAEDFANWKPEQEEFSTALRHAARLAIDFGVPVFDPFYLADCQGRLRLADATLELAVAGPFGRVAVEAFVAHDSGALHCRVRQRLREPVPVEITLERYGSRTFSHWYSLVRRDPRLGLAGTRATAGRCHVGLTHRLSTGTFAVAAGVVDAGSARVRSQRLHAQAARLTVAGRGRCSFRLVACVTAPLSRGSAAAAARRGVAAGAASVGELRRRHRAAWRGFWQRSLMECGEPYLDHLWHLTMYYANASQRGTYPGRFINGLWGWSRDVQNWSFYFHWNQQQTYWPLNAAGHHDLCDAYLEYRFRGLPRAQADARRWFASRGAFVSDVTERRGYNSASERGNHTPVMQIALDFWRQYCYTGDDAFLRRRALPYLRAAARFAESRFELGPDGLYHAREGTAYEGWIRLRDGITVLACSRSLFGAVLAALDRTGVVEPRASTWRRMHERLVPLPTQRADRRLIGRRGREWRLRRGPYQGARADGDRILSAGRALDTGRWMSSRLVPPEPAAGRCDDLAAIVHQLSLSRLPTAPAREETRCLDGIFPSAEYAAVFPAGPIGLAQRGSDAFAAAANTVRLFAPAVMGWDPCLVVLARLGLGPELWQGILGFAETWQFYRNGWGHYGPEASMRADGILRFGQGRARDAALPAAESERPERAAGTSNWAFRHMGMESMSVLACAMNEALLQSHDGVIRVAPAVAAAQEARFTLHATGGFEVSAEVRRGRTAWVAIRARRGGTCRLENPWPRAHLYRRGRRLGSSARPVIELTLPPGGAVVLVPRPAVALGWSTVAARPPAGRTERWSPNQQALLGMPRLY